jgi:hypothetical protein
MNHTYGWMDEWKDGRRSLDLAAQRGADCGTSCCRNYEIIIKKEVVS